MHLFFRGNVGERSTMTEMKDKLVFRTLGFNIAHRVWCFEGIIENNGTQEKFILNVNPDTGEAKVGERI